MGLQHEAEPTHHFQNHLKEMRVSRGLSQSELAVRAGITRQAVFAIEAGKYLPTTAVALHLANVLNCQVEDLFRLIGTGEIVTGELVGALRPESLAKNAALATSQFADIRQFPSGDMFGKTLDRRFGDA